MTQQTQANGTTGTLSADREAELLARIAAVEAERDAARAAAKPARDVLPMRVLATCHVGVGDANAKWIRDKGEFEFAGNDVSVPRMWVAIGRDAKSAEVYQIRDAHAALLVSALTSE